MWVFFVRKRDLSFPEEQRVIGVFGIDLNVLRKAREVGIDEGVDEVRQLFQARHIRFCRRRSVIVSGSMNNPWISIFCGMRICLLPNRHLHMVHLYNIITQLYRNKESYHHHSFPQRFVRGSIAVRPAERSSDFNLFCFFRDFYFMFFATFVLLFSFWSASCPAVPLQRHIKIPPPIFVRGGKTVSFSPLSSWRPAA